MHRFVVLASLLTLVGCDAPEPKSAAKGQPDWKLLDTGRSCAAAKVACGVGNCAARIENRCNKPVICKLSIQCICASYTGESGEARANAQDLILAGDDGGMLARVICTDGDVKATLAKKVRCR